jgi:hypothetical protein
VYTETMSPPGPVAHRFEEIAASAIDLSERDECATKVVAASLAQPKSSEIIVQLLRRQHAVADQHDQIALRQELDPSVPEGQQADAADLPERSGP